MRLYLNERELQKVVEILDDSPYRSTEEIAEVVKRLRQCEALQKHTKRKNPPDEAGR